MPMMTSYERVRANARKLGKKSAVVELSTSRTVTPSSRCRSVAAHGAHVVEAQVATAAHVEHDGSSALRGGSDRHRQKRDDSTPTTKLVLFTNSPPLYMV